ncbi:MAG: phosphoribosylanthranilate isomerase [Candidatus Margulisbacteria bacterium]|nr:phosphoribosylanthranilate isomerase [Candidatus Margulisiibacteriota bacterium]MBU1022401.1 phosphoribosylanthranilate isomerase [Candidatus Margulisiibacteriota bacterium]MBU1729047.1 phosphoribosylanthranilate isomerase [Candidatus Margulisiibacteriota bacterium]MBU1954532.1 phosphoribosylanthranilate isomerase [Candidatus Margulisiibacteriota bacterium]
MKIKICGITSLADAKAAASLQADFLGFIFAKSPRKISVARAERIIYRLPIDVKAVGVFVNEDADKVNQVVCRLALPYVQLHGDESPEYCAKIKTRVIKVIRPRSRKDLEEIKKYKDVFAVLLDTYSKTKRGGTGKTLDWKLAKEAKKYHPHIMLSGGLTPENVAEAVKKVKPFAVDVSSGVEKSPGKKNIQGLRKFIHNARIG